MLYKMMHGDDEVLRFDLTEQYIEVMSNQKLPYMLKDYVKTSELTSRRDFIENSKYIDCIRDFLSSRLLNLSRSGAKTILNVANLPQSLKMEERVKIAIACRGLTMTDNFWLQEESENLNYKDVCLRKNPLSLKSYDISILQHHISATREELRPDLTVTGMYPKFWKRNGNDIELWKTDNTTNFSNTKAEIAVSDMLDHSNVPHVKYRKEELDGRVFAVSKCFANDDEYFVTASDMTDYLNHTGNIISLSDISLMDFSNMVCTDYIIANTDRHAENFGFMADTKTNEILRFADLYDHNNALLADSFGTDIGGLIYEPTGLSFADSLDKYAPYSDVKIEPDHLPTEECKKRYETYTKAREKNREKSVCDVSIKERFAEAYAAAEASDGEKRRARGEEIGDDAREK